MTAKLWGLFVLTVVTTVAILVVSSWVHHASPRDPHVPFPYPAPAVQSEPRGWAAAERSLMECVRVGNCELASDGAGIYVLQPEPHMFPSGAEYTP